jgi:hypothetical protein
MVAQQSHDKDGVGLGPERVYCEAMAVQQRFPSFRFHRTREGGLFVTGKFRTVTGSVYQVLLKYPPDYPLSSPKIYPVPRLSGPHQFPDGSMCLFRPDDRFWRSSSTAVTVLAAAALWLNVREHWLKTGHWLGREHQ